MTHSVTRPMPGAPAPALTLETTSGAWSLADSKPDSFTLVVFYRGVHCPVCKGFLSDLNRLVPDYEAVGTKVIAVSMDGADRAAQAAADWGLDRLQLGYGLTEDQARAWGLYLSEAINDREVPVFCEPALFLIDAAGKFYLINIASMPWARPDIISLPAKIAFATEKSYPVRGNRA